jgi:hypothetical protein
VYCFEILFGKGSKKESQRQREFLFQILILTLIEFQTLSV